MNADDVHTILRVPRPATLINWAVWLALSSPVLIVATRYVLRHKRGHPILLAAVFVLALSLLGFLFGVRVRWMQAQCWHHRSAAAACARLPREGESGWYEPQWWNGVL